jgi:RNA polymerase sigma-70 factor (ECF subfamily)
VDEFRRTRRLVPLEGDAWEEPDPRALADPERSALAQITIERLDALLAQFPSDVRWLFWLREIDGLSYAELAEVFAVPVGTIRSRLARLRVRLVAGLAMSPTSRSRERTKGNGDD